MVFLGSFQRGRKPSGNDSSGIFVTWLTKSKLDFQKAYKGQGQVESMSGDETRGLYVRGTTSYEIVAVLPANERMRKEKARERGRLRNLPSENKGY